MAALIVTTIRFVLTECAQACIRSKCTKEAADFFGRMRLVSAKNFFVRNNDLRITVNYSGYVDIDERRNGRGYDRNGRGYDRNDRGWDGNDRDWDRNDRDGRNRGF